MKNFVVLPFVVGCVVGCGMMNSEIGAIECLKEDLNSSIYKVDGHTNFVSLFFAKVNDRIIVQVVPFLERPYSDSAVFNYKCVDSIYYVCAGYCDDFCVSNGFVLWNDFMKCKYPDFHYYMTLSDSLYCFYVDYFKKIEVRYFEYIDGNLFSLDSISFEEKYEIDCQANDFNIGFLMNGPVPPPPLID